MALSIEVKSLCRVQLFVTPWTVTYQITLTMGFPRQECWSGLPFSSPGDLPDPGIKPRSPVLQVDALPSEPPGNRGNHLKVLFFPISHNKRGFLKYYYFINLGFKALVDYQKVGRLDYV